MTKWFDTIEMRPPRPTDDAFVALDHGALTHIAGVLEDIGVNPVGGVDHYAIVATREAAEGHQPFDYVRARFWKLGAPCLPEWPVAKEEVISDLEASERTAMAGDPRAAGAPGT